MGAAGPVAAAPPRRRVPAWVPGLAPLLVLALLIGSFVALGAPGLKRNGIPVENLKVDRTVLRPGQIELTVRNDGADPVAVRQVAVNGAFAGFRQTTEKIGRLGSSRLTVTYPWIEGQTYEVSLLSGTGNTVVKTIEAAAETPRADAGFFGLMALIGIYVGVIPVATGMLWLPWIRRVDPSLVRFLMALTLGLLGFLGVDALLEGTKAAGAGSQAFGGATLVFLGAAVAYLALTGIDAWLSRRGDHETAAAPWRLAFLVSVGIGLHNLGEGLAIGSAYAIGSLALGASLVIGFAIHNTTEGLAIVAPVARGGAARDIRRLAGLGLLAGAPAVAGAWIGSAAYNSSVTAFLFGLGAGAIVQVLVQIAPSVRDRAGRLLHPVAVGGILAGLAVMYLTGLLVSV